MPETYTLTGSQDPIRGEYHQLLHWTVNGRPSRFILLQVLALPVFAVLGLAFFWLAVYVGRLPAGLELGMAEYALCLAGMAATIALHELLHGLAIRWCGARPQYGVLWKQFMFYATAPGYGFRRNAYIVVALAPLLGLSGLALLAMFLLRGTGWVALLALCAAINGTGALGDLWMVAIVLRYPKSVYVVDERDGIRVLARSATG